ncbi:MAG TPA: amino acid adenylation domain-containing protein, partial [Thermoanaerobaculia bacterium]|nr:amino acid adenylation domain-containing protein [Thermoanaerobaculia bacterium]
AGAFLSLDPDYPRERLAFIVEDARSPLLLTEERHLDRMPETGATVLCLDRAAEEEPAGVPKLASLVRPESLAYVIYTSGSTGRPKAVAVPHGGLSNLVRWHQELYQVTAADRGTLVASPAFDASVWDLWPYLAAGASVHIPDEEARLSADGMLRWWEREGITLSFLPTALAEGVLALPVAATPPTGLRLRALLTGGDRLHGRPPAGVPWRLMNHYGPAESSVVTTTAAIAATAGTAIEGGGSAGELPPLGRPIGNTRVYLLAAWGLPVPLGTPGEIHIAGRGLARGYPGRPDLTAERFLPDPWSGEPGSRMYRTGDLARWLLDGRLDFLGRGDHQVKIRGFRIELGEIEAVLASHPEILETVVLAREEVPGEKVLVAYVVAGGEASPAALSRFLSERLPAYMVPTFFVTLDRLPLTANGKVDREALPAPERARQGSERAFLAPRDTLETELAQIWESLLGIAPIGVGDDFFALGGHSLLAVQLMARVESQLGRRLPTASVLLHPTVERFAALLREAASPAAAAEVQREILVEIRAERRPDPSLDVRGVSGAASGRPVFLVHAIGGDVLSYVHLARSLPEGRALWGLQAPEVGEDEAERTIESMAALYLSAVRRVQPEGPYTLGGWSMGGVVAFEMARQLERAGEAVDLLALFDTYAPRSAGRPRQVKDGELVAWFAYDLARLFGLGLLELPLGFGELSAAAALDWLRKRAEVLPPGVEGLEGSELERRFNLFRAHYRANERYAAGPATALPLVLYKAAEAPAAPRLEPDHGWGRLLGEPVEVHDLPGDHYSLLQRPHVEHLAVLLRERLEPRERELPATWLPRPSPAPVSAPVAVASVPMVASRPPSSRAVSIPTERAVAFGFPRRFNMWMQDFKFAVRQLRRNPSFALIALLTLALGIGANTAIFSAINGVLLRPLPYSHGDRLVHIGYRPPASGMGEELFSVPELADLRQQSKTLDGLMEYHSMEFTLLDQGEPDRVRTGVVSANFFPELGVRPYLGRTFRPDDERRGANPVLVLTYPYWQRHFGGDLGVLGQVLKMNGRPITIVGILPDLPQYPQDNDVFMPTADCPVRMDRAVVYDRNMRMVELFGRVKPGIPLERVRADLSTVAERLHQAFPASYPDRNSREVPLVSVREELVGPFRPTLLVLLGTVGLVLLIACANVANLTLARLLRREREVVVRAALGAGRGRLIRQLLIESTLLSLAGGMLGLLFALAGRNLLVAYAHRYTARAGEIAINGQVLLFTVLVAVSTGIAFGWIPALQASRRDLA